MNGIRWKILGPPVLIGLCLLLLCALTGVSLYRQQATTARILREHVASRRAATELEECLVDLLSLLKVRVESVTVLHQRVRIHLEAILHMADQQRERNLAQELMKSFESYLAGWRVVPPTADPGHEKAIRDLAEVLEVQVLRQCQELEQYNTQRIEEATRLHERVLEQLAWGMAIVSVLGGAAGLILGVAVSQGLRRSIRRLQIQLEDAAGKLGYDFGEIVVQGEGDFQGLHQQVETLTSEIEGVVNRLQQRELEVMRSEQLAAVGQLAAGVGHEIRNPLTSIKMLVQTGLESGANASLSVEDLQVIEGEVRRMERSLQTFLDFARPPRLEKRRIDLLAVVQTVVDLVRGRVAKQQVRLTLDLPPGPVWLTADAEQLQQVLVNLVLNGLDAMLCGGKLSIVLRPGDRELVLEVADTGPGISSEMIPRLFQPFASNKETGLGLGLVISRRIVEDHGGTLTAAKRAPQGAVFRVCLPVDPGEGPVRNS